jgi:signal transduction histidine kinase
VVLITYTDISELKIARETIKKSSLALQQLHSRLATALDAERARIAREFHDHVGQALMAAKLNLYQAGAIPLGASGAQKVRQRLKQAMSAMDTASSITQQLCMELRPAMLDDVSLADAIRWHVRQIQGLTKIRLKLEVDPDLRIGREASIALFRILQESLTNVVRHAKAREVQVSLLPSEGCAQLTIHDNGRGMDTRKKNIGNSLGLLGMRERAAAVGGEVEVQSEPGRGTTVMAQVPVRNDSKAPTAFEK